MSENQKEEPKVILATVRDSGNEEFPMLDIECRFSDGQKLAAIQVYGDFPELAESIRKFLCQNSPDADEALWKFYKMGIYSFDK